MLYTAKDLDLDAVTYEDLSDPKWKGKVCIRFQASIPNHRLIADYIAHYGAEETVADRPEGQPRPQGGRRRPPKAPRTFWAVSATSPSPIPMSA